MSWLYSRALVEGYSAEGCSDGKQCAPSNTTNTPEMYLWQGKTTEALSLSRYGMTCEHLTDARGKELLTSYLEDFRVKILASQEKVQESKENDQDYGKSFPGSFARFDLDTCSWKTAQLLLFQEWESFSETWPRWGIMHDGECIALETWGHNTSENAAGSWPTPTKWEEKYIFSKSPGDHYHGIGWIFWNQLRRQPFPNVYEMMMGWPIGWTALQDVETDKFLQWLDLHGNH